MGVFFNKKGFTPLEAEDSGSNECLNFLANKKFNAPHKLLTGFTLVEILVVIFIIAILALVGVVFYRGQQAKARDTQRVSDLKNIQTAIELYIQSNPEKLPPGVDFDAGSANCGTSDIYGWGDTGTGYSPGIFEINRALAIPSDGTFMGDLSSFMKEGRLPLDPKDNGGYTYLYCRCGSSYVLASVMEKNQDFSSDFDGSYNGALGGIFNNCIYSNSAWEETPSLDCDDVNGELGDKQGSVYCTGFQEEGFEIITDGA